MENWCPDETIDELRDVLYRNGFVRCDIPACNCGSWHPRYGFPERVQELKTMLDDAGYPLCNDNGHLLRNALADLIAERDRLRKDIDAYAAFWQHITGE